MKKLICLLSAVLLVLASCSSDDATEPVLSTNGTKLKRGMVMNDVGATVVMQDYIYNGNKLARIESSSVNYSSFTYTNDLITKMEKYTNNSLVSTSFLDYNTNNKLISVKSISNSSNNGYKTIYDYNLDGTITVTVYEGDSVNQNTVVKNKKVFFANGLVSKIEEYKVINGNLETLTTQYTYDNKNDPTYAILGYNKLTFYDIGSYGNPNNIASITYTATNSSISNTTFFQFTYNSYDYPITSIESYGNGGSPNTVKYYYE
jgi:hypothetical protein